MEFLENRPSWENLKTPRKSPEKWIFLSLAFYNAPSLHTVNWSSLSWLQKESMRWLGALSLQERLLWVLSQELHCLAAAWVRKGPGLRKHDMTQQLENSTPQPSFSLRNVNVSMSKTQPILHCPVWNRTMTQRTPPYQKYDALDMYYA